MNLSKLISYYKDCYQADTRTLALHNIFSKKVENRFFLDGKDDLLNSNLPFYPVPDEYADAVERNLTLYKREKACVFVDALTVEDYKILSRAGLPTFPLPYTYWKFEEDQCFSELMNFAKF